VLWVTIANLAYRLLGFPLLPLFKVTFNAFHAWCHFVLNGLVYSWLTSILGWMWYGSVWLASWVFPLVPWRPRIVVPGWWSDLALVSLALTRVFQSADLIVPRHIRAEAEGQMTDQLWAEIQSVEGRFWGALHRFFHRINALIWEGIGALTDPDTTLTRAQTFRVFVRRVLISLAGSVLLWGFIRLPGYVIHVFAARHLSSPMVLVRRRLFKYFSLNLLGAVAATLMFVVVNAWLAGWLEPA